MRTLLLVLALSIMGAAQHATVESSDTESSSKETAAESGIDPQPLPQAPQKFVDRKWFALTAYQAANSVLDIESTVRMQEQHRCKEGWSSWLVGEHPGRARLYTTASIANVGSAYLAYFLRKKDRKYWWVPQLTAGTVHGFAAGRNRYLLGCF